MRYLPRPRGVALALSAPVIAAIVATWWWLGAPVPLPASPLGKGEKLYCMSYSPFRGSQTPFDRALRVDARQIDDDLARLAPLTECVRTYSTELGLDQVAGIAGRHGLKVIQGVWLGRERTRNRTEIETAVALAARYPGTVQALVAGNEVLLRGELSPGDLAGLIREIKARVAVPVTYADVWEFWLRNRAVADAVDFVTVHILPYWEDIPIPAEAAAAHVADIRRMVAAAFPGKEILLGEVGWPSAGRMREGALPSPTNQARVIEEVLAAAKRDGFRANLIEAFDQPWKRQLEGTVGGHWGLLDGASRAPKFAWGMPLSNHPQWPWQAAIGVLLAAAAFSAAAAAGHSGAIPRARGHWFGVAAIALVAGVLIGWAAANVPLESLGVGGWIHSLAMLAVALVAPVLGAAALGGGIPIPAFSQVLEHDLQKWIPVFGKRSCSKRKLERDDDSKKSHHALRDAKDRTPSRLGFALGAVWIVLCAIATEVALGLAFDPRYRDFPFAPLGAAVTPFVVLTMLGVRCPRRDLAEIVMAAVLATSTLYVAWNEGPANWQALCLCGVFAGLVFTLLRPWAVPSSK
ncbi:MAG TPA: beta-(1-6) glucans synthase [Xanthobacteraceae bacterium]|nr:beta-(1-6) glucans synthase [Xanthobacteraceae bacterium]